MDVSENSGTPKSSILIGVFQYKPSILGYHYFWKHPYQSLEYLHRMYPPQLKGLLVKICGFVKIRQHVLGYHHKCTLIWKINPLDHAISCLFFQNGVQILLWPSFELQWNPTNGLFWDNFPCNIFGFPCLLHFGAGEKTQQMPVVTSSLC